MRCEIVGVDRNLDGCGPFRAQTKILLEHDGRGDLWMKTLKYTCKGSKLWKVVEKKLMKS